MRNQALLSAQHRGHLEVSPFSQLTVQQRSCTVASSSRLLVEGVLKPTLPLLSEAARSLSSTAFSQVQGPSLKMTSLHLSSRNEKHYKVSEEHVLPLQPHFGTRYSAVEQAI